MCTTVHPPIFGSGGGAHSLAGEGVGSQLGRGDRHLGTLGIHICTLCLFHPMKHYFFIIISDISIETTTFAVLMFSVFI
jgi:hypothetical protein